MCTSWSLIASRSLSHIATSAVTYICDLCHSSNVLTVLVPLHRLGRIVSLQSFRHRQTVLASISNLHHLPAYEQGLTRHPICITFLHTSRAWHVILVFTLKTSSHQINQRHPFGDIWSHLFTSNYHRPPFGDISFTYTQTKCIIATLSAIFRSYTPIKLHIRPPTESRHTHQITNTYVVPPI